MHKTASDTWNAQQQFEVFFTFFFFLDGSSKMHDLQPNQTCRSALLLPPMDEILIPH